MALSLPPETGAARPAMFADTGISRCFNALNGRRILRSNLRIYLAGGRSVSTGPTTYKIGPRNLKAACYFLNIFGFQVTVGDGGGGVNRTLHLKLETEMIKFKEPGRPREFTPN